MKLTVFLKKSTKERPGKNRQGHNSSQDGVAMIRQSWFLLFALTILSGVVIPTSQQAYGQWLDEDVPEEMNSWQTDMNPHRLRLVTAARSIHHAVLPCHELYDGGSPVYQFPSRVVARHHWGDPSCLGDRCTPAEYAGQRFLDIADQGYKPGEKVYVKEVYDRDMPHTAANFLGYVTYRAMRMKVSNPAQLGLDEAAFRDLGMRIIGRRSPQSYSMGDAPVTPFKIDWYDAVETELSVENIFRRTEYGMEMCYESQQNLGKTKRIDRDYGVPDVPTGGAPVLPWDHGVQTAHQQLSNILVCSQTPTYSDPIIRDTCYLNAKDRGVPEEERHHLETWACKGPGAPAHLCCHNTDINEIPANDPSWVPPDCLAKYNGKVSFEERIWKRRFHSGRGAMPNNGKGRMWDGTTVQDLAENYNIPDFYKFLPSNYIALATGQWALRRPEEPSSVLEYDYQPGQAPVYVGYAKTFSYESSRFSKAVETIVSAYEITASFFPISGSAVTIQRCFGAVNKTNVDIPPNTSIPCWVEAGASVASDIGFFATLGGSQLATVGRTAWTIRNSNRLLYAGEALDWLSVPIDVGFAIEAAGNENYWASVAHLVGAGLQTGGQINSIQLGAKQIVHGTGGGPGKSIYLRKAGELRFEPFEEVCPIPTGHVARKQAKRQIVVKDSCSVAECNVYPDNADRITAANLKSSTCETHPLPPSIQLNPSIDELAKNQDKYFANYPAYGSSVAVDLQTNRIAHVQTLPHNRASDEVTDIFPGRNGSHRVPIEQGLGIPTPPQVNLNAGSIMIPGTNRSLESEFIRVSTVEGVEVFSTPSGRVIHQGNMNNMSPEQIADNEAVFGELLNFMRSNGIDPADLQINTLLGGAIVGARAPGHPLQVNGLFTTVVPYAGQTNHVKLRFGPWEAGIEAEIRGAKLDYDSYELLFNQINADPSLSGKLHKIPRNEFNDTRGYLRQQFDRQIKCKGGYDPFKGGG